MTRRRRGVAVGAGYFSQFHFDAWSRIDAVDLVALCDRDATRASATAARHGVPAAYDDVERMLDEQRPDFIDIITPPDTHEGIVALAAARGIAVICQKALAPSFEAARRIVAAAEAAGIRFMVHDNFRFQPWHREIRRQIDAGRIGELQGISCRTRLGDGWGRDAYLARQPYFREMPQFLIFETGVHLIDVFRFLGGEIASVLADVRRLNPVIAGEDRVTLLCRFAGGATALWDADRYHHSGAADPRFTFGAFLIEGSKGALRLDEDGSLTFLSLSGTQEPIDYLVSHAGFAGDCVHATLTHFVRSMIDDSVNELGGRDYLHTLAVQEAAYRSADSGAFEPAGLTR